MQCNLSSSSYLAITLINIDMRFVQKKGKDACMQAVSDENFSAHEHGYGALEHMLVVELAFIAYLKKD